MAKPSCSILWMPPIFQAPKPATCTARFSPSWTLIITAKNGTGWITARECAKCSNCNGPSEAWKTEQENPMATITMTPAEDTILVELFIDAPPARVFEAITDPAQLLQWWGQEGMYRTTKWQGDLRVGGSWRSEGVGADGS